MNTWCYVYRRPNLRSFSVEMESYIGLAILNNLFNGNPVQDYSVGTIFLSFPERWLNILEQRALINRIEQFYPKCEELIIKTHSVYIIQCVKSENVLLFDLTEPIIDDYSSLTKVYFSDEESSKMNLFKEGKITQMGWSDFD